MTLPTFRQEKTSRIFPFLFLLTLILGASLMISCNQEDEDPPIAICTPSTSLNKIMPLGASRVEGNRPEFESFRYELWKQLVNGGWDFDYLGTQNDNASYEDFQGLLFDNDHEGRGGWTSGEILGGIDEWVIQTGAPDIVLFSSPGGNDILNGLASFDQTVANINAIIDALQAANSNVTIVIEELAPGKTDFMTAEMTANFEKIQQEVLTIAAAQSTTNSEVVTVDMFSGFNDSYLADDVHYNEAGAKFIADRYYMVLQGLLEQ